MRNNGQLIGKVGVAVTVLTIVIVAVGGYAVMRHQVGTHEKRIQAVESLQAKSMTRLEKIETMQESQGKQIDTIGGDVRTLLLRSGGAP